MPLRSGRSESLPYSLSRWTDVPAAKWEWFQEALDTREMTAFAQTDLVPARWSLAPEDTLALLFWTKDATNLVSEHSRLRAYDVRIHLTVTGWEEAEKGAPSLRQGANMLSLVTGLYGADKVTWRFSPVPLVADVARRFDTIAAIAQDAGLKDVYLSFLQDNEFVPETRSVEEKLNVLAQLAEVAERRQIQVRLCNDDTMLESYPNYHSNLSSGVCVPPDGFMGALRAERCGCALMVDPFTINEACTFGCTYCYAADRSLSVKKHNTTKSLPVLQG